MPRTGASKGTPDNEKCIKEILGEVQK